MTPSAGRHRDLRPALAFLLPNFLGFLVFVAGPVLFSLAVAFTNWNLQRTVPFRVIGLRNFVELAHDNDFWLYFFNTVYLMLGMPVAIGGSLLLALLLSQRLRGIVGYRTGFYLPTFTSGVALMILWKALYNPDFGPINAAIEWLLGGIGEQDVGLNDVLARLGAEPLSSPKWLQSTRNLFGLALTVGVVLAVVVVWRLYRGVRGSKRVRRPFLHALTFAVGATLLILITRRYLGVLHAVVGAALLMAGYLAVSVARERRRVASHTLFWLLTGATVVVFLLVLVPLYRRGLAVEQVGLTPKQFGVGARDAIMIMGIWIAIGGNNMLLYLAALSNVPQELYEAAAIDGAGKWQSFWNVTWPQLAPTTFFIVVMSFIGGLQGGFEQARVMTAGGPAGTTTTLTYYIYTKAFEEFEIGYASSIAWVLFVIIFVVTLVNWRFGSRELSY